MKTINKILTWILVVTFLSQDIGWTITTIQAETVSHQLLDIIIPEQYGSIEKSNLAKNQTVVLIKDAHCNYEAQTNISKILNTLIADYNMDLVCVEGAEGEVNTYPFSAFYDEEARIAVADKYLRKGYLSAADALSIMKGDKSGFKIWGIEDSRVYLDDFKAFRETLIDNAQNIGLINELIKTAGILKQRIYNPGLLSIDRHYEDYKKDIIKLSDWIGILRAKAFGISNYKNILLVTKSLKLESEIDFNSVEKERSRLIQLLEKTLPREDLQKLVRDSLLFKLGKLNTVSYYTHLKELAGSELSQNPNLNKYIRLVQIQKQIDSEKLFAELDSLRSEVWNRLFIKETERKLYEIDNNLSILDSLLALEISREDLQYYKSHINEFDLEKMRNFINIQCGIEGLPAVEIQSDSLQIEPAERFYEIAIKRDRILVDNLLKKMEGDKRQFAGMVIGGFHAEGIVKLLGKKDISYIVISPKITKAQEDNPYLSIMLHERIDIDRLVEKVSQTSLAPPDLFGNLADPEIRRDLARGLVLFKAQPVNVIASKLSGRTLENFRILCSIAGITIEEERRLEEFITVEKLQSGILDSASSNPSFAAFLLELLIAQEGENPEGIGKALRQVIEGLGKAPQDENIQGILSLARGHLPAIEHMESVQIPPQHREEHYAESGFWLTDSIELTPDVVTRILNYVNKYLFDKSIRQGQLIEDGFTFTLKIKGITELKLTVVKVNDRTFYVPSYFLDRERGFGKEVFREILTDALDAVTKVEGLPVTPILLTSVKRSPRLFGDCVGNGLIVINEAFFKMRRWEEGRLGGGQKWLDILMQIGLEHELMHEKRREMAVEEKLRLRDIARIERVCGRAVPGFLEFLKDRGIAMEDFMEESPEAVTEPAVAAAASQPGTTLRDIIHTIFNLHQSQRVLWRVGGKKTHFRGFPLGYPIEKSDDSEGDEDRFDGAYTLLRERMDEMVTAVNERDEALWAIYDYMEDRWADERKADPLSVDRLNLLHNLISAPDEFLWRERFDRTVNPFKILTLEDMDFLSFNNERDYVVGHFDPEKANAVYLPQTLYDSVKDSPNLLAALLLKVMLDGITIAITAEAEIPQKMIDELSSLSDRLVGIIDPEGKLAEAIKKLAQDSKERSVALAEEVFQVIGGRGLLAGVERLEYAVENSQICRSTLPLVIELVAEKIRSDEKKGPPALISLSFYLSGSHIRNILTGLVRNKGEVSGDTGLSTIMTYIYNPFIFYFSEYTFNMEEIVEAVEGGRGLIMAEQIRQKVESSWGKKIRQGDSQTLKELKWALKELIFMLPYNLYNSDDTNIRKNCTDFIYGTLRWAYELRIYSEDEYLELVIHLGSKIERLPMDNLESALRTMEKLVDDHLPLHNAKFDENWKERTTSYFNRSREMKRMVTGAIEYPWEHLKKVGYDTGSDFLEQLTLLFLNTDILERSLRTEGGKEFFSMDRIDAIEQIHISPITVTGHTLISLVSVRIGGAYHLFVLKTGFGLLSMTGRVNERYNELVGDDGQNRLYLANQYGEWITPHNTNNRLIGYFRTEEFLPGLTLNRLMYVINTRTKEALPGMPFSSLPEMTKKDLEEYRLAETITSAMYYILLRNVAKDRWFIGDASTSNVMFYVFGDDIYARPTDYEARVELKESLDDRFFIGWLENRGFRREMIEKGISLAQVYTKNGRFDRESLISAGFSEDAVHKLIRELKLYQAKRLMDNERQAVGIAGTQGAQTAERIGQPEPEEDTIVDYPAGTLAVSRIVAIGDVHGGLIELQKSLSARGLIEERDGEFTWTGGNATLVQLGDVFDRGIYSEEAFQFLLDLKDTAEARGGRVILLLGNHELAYLRRDDLVSGMRAFEAVKKLSELRDSVRELKKEIREYERLKATEPQRVHLKILRTILKGKEAGIKHFEKEYRLGLREKVKRAGLIKNAIREGKMQAMFTVRDPITGFYTIFSHAGIERGLIEEISPEIEGEVNMDSIAEHCNKILTDAVNASTEDEMEERLQHRIFDKDGIFWTRFESLEELDGIRQVIAHNPPGAAERAIRFKASRDGAVGIFVVHPKKGGQAVLEIGPEGVVGRETTTDASRLFTSVRLALEHFQELAVPEGEYKGPINVAWMDIPAGIIDERERAQEIRRQMLLDENGKELEDTGLGVVVIVSNRPEDTGLNNILRKNIIELLERLPDKEKTEFLTALKEKVPDGKLVLAILDQSFYYGENCQGDGFVGVNRKLFSALSPNLLQAILYHELRHEAFPDMSEDEQYKKDLGVFNRFTVEPGILDRLGIAPGSRIFIDLAVIEIADRLKPFGVEIDEAQRNVLRERLANVLGEAATRIDILELIDNYRKEHADKLFIIAGAIASVLNTFLPRVGLDRRAQAVAVIMQEIWGLIPVKERREDLLATIIAKAEGKGVVKETVEYLYKLFEAGMQILILEPDLDIDKVDAAYLDIVRQLEEISGIRGLYNKFKDRFNIKAAIPDTQAITGSLLWRELKRLEEYNREYSRDEIQLAEMDTEENRKYRFWDFLFRADNTVLVTGDGARTKNQFLSTLDVVRKDVDRIVNLLRGGPARPAVDLSENTGVLVPISMLVLRREDGSFTYNPGIESILGNLYIQGVSIGLMVPKGDHQYDDILSVMDKRIQVIRSDDPAEAHGEMARLGVPSNRISTLTEKEGIDRGYKPILVEEGTPLHIAVLFGIIYARIEVFREDELTPEAREVIGDFLARIGEMSEKDISDKLDELNREGYLRLKLIRMKDILQNFQNQIYVKISA